MIANLQNISTNHYIAFAVSGFFAYKIYDVYNQYSNLYLEQRTDKSDDKSDDMSDDMSDDGFDGHFYHKKIAFVDDDELVTKHESEAIDALLKLKHI